MRFFIIPDIHGHLDSLEGLLKKAGVIDEAGDRVDGIFTVSVGDLANAVQSSVNGDSECLLKVPEWIDRLCIGNHEMPWIYGGISMFNGFYDAAHNGSLYREFMREGIVVPAFLIEEHNVLISHAGVHRDFAFESAKEAYDKIIEVYETQPSGWEKLGTYSDKPLRYLLAGGSRWRGDVWSPVPGIFWKDWQEPMNKNFSQIVGHTPISKPDLWRRQDGTFSVNIDCGAKHGHGATGMFFDNGEIEFVEYSAEPEPAGTVSQ